MPAREQYRIVGSFRLCRVANEGKIGVFVERLSGMCFVLVLEDATQEMAEVFYRTIDEPTLRRHEASLKGAENCITLVFDAKGNTFDRTGKPN